MIIRRARASDAERIHAIAESIRLNRDSYQNGFLVHVPSPEQYRSCISLSPFFYVAQNEETDGFLMCYDSGTLQTLRENGQMEHEDNLVDFVLQNELPYVFGDQIGVRPGKIRQGIGKSMMIRLFEDMEIEHIPTMYVGILHDPVRNGQSIYFCTDLGFEEIGEVTNSDGYVWGVYRKTI
jgi:predicted GNAT superfamily acetyltransferase